MKLFCYNKVVELSRCSMDDKLVRFLNKIFFVAPYVYIVICILVNPFNGYIFYFDQHYVYTHGPGMPILYVISCYYIFCALVYVIWFRKVISRMQKYMIYFFILGNLFGLIIQLLVDGLLIVGYCVAVSIVLVYISLQNPTLHRQYQDS